ncbi:DEAD-domain-containing protein [Aaosphaeria arxii CBS 175.79]|uniref:ATP-dependent RNA helicase n=1 Tax=Aaosphaeria arxii CBS 175.79 TaxID=1450172 RepID=A0A6A5XGW5_9PLEO|nr:DEAD-domain-containing protein [Aaosphaeria arxii CBS 175.79]KAF2012428.1 DEAD-domain-containing protein [Aaosphaeria arxii CBS 175.79]
MPPPPKNKQGQSGRRRHPYRTKKPANDANSTTPAQQPKLSNDNNDAVSQPEVIDVKGLYGNSASGGEARPFSSLGRTLDQSLLNGLNRMGFEYMSPVQQKVLTELPSLSSDCLVQAKTGTGKTAAFLLPAIQNLLNGNQPRRGKVGILAICPTRELALQIAKECEGITACMNKRIECHTAFGGTSRASALSKFLRGDPTVLVATPGRLDDILGEEEVRERFDELKTVVLDEADRMLDQGFAPAIYKILKHLPPKQMAGWQGMCFSATLPEKVNDVVKCVLFPGYTYLSTVDPNEAPTVDRVPQYSILVPTAKETFTALYALLEAEYNQSPSDFKVIVFGTTANGVGLLYDLFKAALPQFKLYELHSRMSQGYRTRTSNEFKEAASGILFASDVVGRGMDFPNVGLVIQVDLPSSQEQYIHRVGRTARAGRDGRAVTILFDNEAFFIKTNPSLPIKPYPTALNTTQYQGKLDAAFAQIDEEAKAKAYQAFLGYNKTYMKKLRLDAKGLVQIANEYAFAMGCPEPPMIERKVVGKMGLKGVPGLNIGTRK